MSYCIIGVMGYVEDSKGNFRGVKGAGKDTLVDTWMSHYGKDYEVLKIPMAEYMKSVLKNRYDFKKSHMNNKGKEQMLDLSEKPEASFRDLCIQLGTSVVREELKCDMFWLNYMDKQIQSFIKSFEEELQDFSGLPFEEIVKVLKKHMPNWKNQGKKKIVFIPDIRFQNEYDYFNQKYGKHCYMVQVKRVVNNLSPRSTDQHISNRSHASMEPDFVLYNQSTPENLAHAFQSKLCILNEL